VAACRHEGGAAGSSKVGAAVTAPDMAGSSYSQLLVAQQQPTGWCGQVEWRVCSKQQQHVTLCMTTVCPMQAARRGDRAHAVLPG
jgi:hypothetical protein